MGTPRGTHWVAWGSSWVDVESTGATAAATSSYASACGEYFIPSVTPEDRFSGIATEIADNGSPVRGDALAYLECFVHNRMETGDHWVVYAVVENGKVLKPDAVTAVHHRKSGNHY